MAKITAVMTDLSKAEKGVWADYAEGIQLCIASIDNPEYKKRRAAILKPHQRERRTGSINNETVLDMLKPAIAKHVLVGWKNIEDESGKPLEYSAETALEFLRDPALSDLYYFVLEIAGEAGMYRRGILEESVKNSLKP